MSNKAFVITTTALNHIFCNNCEHKLYEHAIFHKPAQNAKGYISGDYMYLGCNILECNCSGYEPKEIK